jgi:hypothetical protein
LTRVDLDYTDSGAAATQADTDVNAAVAAQAQNDNG